MIIGWAVSLNRVGERVVRTSAEFSLTTEFSGAGKNPTQRRKIQGDPKIFREFNTEVEVNFCENDCCLYG